MLSAWREPPRLHVAILSETYNFLFLLSPGTGSTSVSRALVDAGVGVWCPQEDLQLSPGKEGLVPRKHTTYPHFKRWNLLPRPLAEYQVVTTVRNPFDFWISEYLRHRHRWSAHLENPGSHIFTKASDAESVRQAVELEFPEWMRLKWSKFDDKHAEMLHPRFAAKADYFLRFEELPASFRAWMAERGVPGSIELGHDNVTSRERDYRPYYDEATRQLLERVYRFYLRRFQYSFA